MKDMEESEISFETECYDENAAVPEGHPYKTITTFIRVNESKKNFFIESHIYKDSIYGSTTFTTGLFFTLKKWSDLEKIERFVNKIMEQTVSDRSLTIEVEEGTCYERHSSDFYGAIRESEKVKEVKKEKFKKIQIDASPRTANFLFSGACLHGALLPYFTKEINEKAQNKDNLKKFRKFLEEIAHSDTKLEKVIDDRIKKILEGTKYGKEVIKHVRDGDKCYKNGLIHPALGSYIHAFEWAIISYLESKENVDIIEEEKNGKGEPYLFKNLLDTLLRYNKNIDQKTITKLKEINRAERRWIAHHKSGKTLTEEVKAIRARLKEFLENLYS